MASDMPTHLRFLGWGVSNWQAAFEWIGAGLRQRRPELSVAILGKGPRRMEALADGEVDAAITTPTADAGMARAGIGPHHRPLPQLRAIAALPHRDRLLLAVNEAAADRYGLRTLHDVVEREAPLRLTAPERDGDSPNFGVEQLLALHGAKWEDLTRWGGRWFEMPAPMPGPALLAAGDVDGIFNEAYMLLHTLPRGMRVRVLAPEPAALESLRSQFGLQTAYLEPGEFPGLDERVPALDFSDWVIVVRADLPEDLARLMAKVVIEDRKQYESRFSATPVHMSALFYPMSPGRLCRTGDVPLHPGAEAYYREQGLL